MSKSLCQNTLHQSRWFDVGTAVVMVHNPLTWSIFKLFEALNEPSLSDYRKAFGNIENNIKKFMVGLKMILEESDNLKIWVEGEWEECLYSYLVILKRI